MSSNALVPGDVGSDWYTKFNANDARLDTETTARAAGDTALAATVATLAAQVTTLSNLVYQAPVGSYVAPTVNARFVYSVKSTPWTTLTYQSRASSVAVTGTPLVLGAGAWGTGIWVVTSSTNYGLTIFRYDLDGSYNATYRVGTYLDGNASSRVMGIVAISATVLRVTWIQTSNVYYNTFFTWDPIGGTLTQTVIGNWGAGVWSYGGYLGVKAGMLVGTTSWLFYTGCPQTFTVGNHFVADRNNTGNGFGAYVGAAIVGGCWDDLGGGYSLVARAFSSAADPNNRVRVSLNFADDYSVRELSYLRFSTNTVNAAPNLQMIAFSNTLSVVQWTDVLSVQRCAAITTNTAAGTLGLVNTYTGGNLGAQSFGVNQPLYALWGPTDAYVVRRATGASASKFMHINYNSSASAGSELTSNPANDISFNFGAGLAGITASSIGAVVQISPDVLLFCGGVTATTTAIVVETWTAS